MSPVLNLKASSKVKFSLSLRAAKKFCAVLISWARNSTHSPLISTRGLFSFTKRSNSCFDKVCPPIANSHLKFNRLCNPRRSFFFVGVVALIFKPKRFAQPSRFAKLSGKITPKPLSSNRQPTDLINSYACMGLRLKDAGNACSKLDEIEG